MPFAHQLGLQLAPASVGPPRLPIDDEFDVVLANDLARLESFNKLHYRPNTYLHKWWARRCGTTFRLILKHLVTSEAQRDFFTPGGLDGKIILDPMMGGGTTLHEAIRLGANVIGLDIDPIPVLQARATLSDVDQGTMQAAFDTLTCAVREAIGPLFMTCCPHCDRALPLRFLLYGLERRCACGPVYSVDSLILRYRADGVPVRLCPRCHNIQAGEPCQCRLPVEGVPIVERATHDCPTCEAAYVDVDRPYYARYQPLVVAGNCPEDGLFFTAPRLEDSALLAEANGRRRTALPDAATMAVAPGPKSDALLRRGIISYSDLFSSRQLLYMAAAQQTLPQFEERVRLKLALLLSTSLEFNSLLCGFKGRKKRRPGAIRHTFSHHAYAFPHTALENNPLHPERASGTLEKLFHDRVRRARRWAQAPRERRPNGNRSTAVTIVGENDFGVEVDDPADFPAQGHGYLVRQQSATNLPLADDSVDFVVTDPPYFDSVQYSDLAAFFRVWLQQLLPEGTSGAPGWQYDRAESAVMPRINGNGQYGTILGDIFAECHRVLRKESGRLIFTYHHWNPKSWAALTGALQRANFVLLNRYVVHAESPISVHVVNMKALLHDVILVLAPAETGLRREWVAPATIEAGEGADFLEDCGAMLGYLLNTRPDADEVHQAWHSRMAYNARPGRRNGR